MSLRTIEMTEALAAYARKVALREPPILAGLREETAALAEANMQIGPEQGQFMSLLVELLQVERALEVGTFTGYSTLAMALALPPGGRIVTCDVSEEWTSIARRYWAEAGVADRIDLRLGPALATLDALLADGLAGRFDFAFIDADKPAYGDYFERALALVRPGGLIAVDNVLWEGAVVDVTDSEPSTVAIRVFNERLRDDDRVSLSLVPIGDGLTLARRRA
ncbi:MAG: O-methyltransferase [Gemmatimonadota bacterium]